jgi:hypothetical protein
VILQSGENIEDLQGYDPDNFNYIVHQIVECKPREPRTWDARIETFDIGDDDCPVGSYAEDIYIDESGESFICCPDQASRPLVVQAIDTPHCTPK